MSLVVPTVCAESALDFSNAPILSYAQRCEACGHPIANHVFGEYCELCQFEVRLRKLENPS